MEIKYHDIHHEISRGPITTVYKARHLNLDRSVLLKVLNPQWLHEKDLLERFKREAQISARLEHPNIVKVYDFTVSPELVFISLEYIDGCSLEDYIKLHHPVEPDICQNIIKDILSAVHYAHLNKIIHRDIKPANILIDKNNKAYLTDFGLAAIKDLDKITQQGQIAGTPAYLAPERVRGQQATKESDLYSLGITIFELLTAKSPFRRENTAATLQSILSGKMPELPVKDLPHWITQLVQKLTHNEPGHRSQYIEIYKTLFDSLPQETRVNEKRKNFYTKKWVYSAVPVALLIVFALWIDSDPLDQAKVDTATPVSQNIYLEKKDPIPVADKTEPIADTTLIVQIPQQKNSSVPNKNADPANSDTLQNVIKKGGLYIQCIPWATIFINNDSMDTTPIHQPIELSAGHYELLLKNPNYADLTQTIEIKQNTTDTLSFKLKEAYGYLFIQTSPWAKIYINNQYRDDTPLLDPILVQSGQNIIELVNPQYHSIYDTIFVAAGKKIQKRYSFAD